MRRWNGWGDEGTTYPLPDVAAEYLATLVGHGEPEPDAEFQSAVASVPASRLPSHPLVSDDPADRLLHARGQSLPDWVALRSGRIGVFPDGVAYPTTDEDIRSLFTFARKTSARLIPYGGGTSVVGHINPLKGDSPVLTLDLSRMNRLLRLDQVSGLATFEAGVRGPELEDQLKPQGFTLGHFPQSFELSTLGGWIATRSSGQQSYHYGRIEDTFAGGHLETLAGPLDLPPLPASAAGPDVKHLILGSEGRLGVITRAIVRTRRLPEAEQFYGVFFRDWQAGADAVRGIAQAGIAVSMLRLSDAQEAETTLALSGKEELVRWADRGLRLLRYGSERCLLVLGVTGGASAVRAAYRQATSLCRAHGGLMPLRAIGSIWRKSRFLTPYLRNTLWEKGYALDTVETAVPWSAVLPTAAAVKASIASALTELGERVLVFAHLSHVYQDGASTYVTFLFRRAHDPEETVERWRRLKASATLAILAHGGTISHQHGVGLDHAPYLTAEKGQVGMAMLQAARRALDPDGMLNPGKLLAGE
jgi:alkyldihydroxyacetonephosphate synthase